MEQPMTPNNDMGSAPPALLAQRRRRRL